MQNLVYQSTMRRILLKAYSNADHVSAATGRTLSVQLSKNGAAFAAPAAATPAVAEIGSGWYSIDLLPEDTNVVGPLLIRATGTGTDDVEQVFDVVPAVSVGGQVVPCVNVTSAGGTPITPSEGTASAVTAASITLGAADPRTAFDLTNWEIEIVGAATNMGQRVLIHGYDIATRTATVAWAGGMPTGTTLYNLRSPVAVRLEQTGFQPRDVSAVADSQLTLGDALVGSIVASAGQEFVSGTTYTVRTPATGTTYRAFTLNDATAPTQRV